MELSTVIALSVNAVAYSMLLFLVASGLSLVFGMTRILNLAHGGFFLLAGFTTVSLAEVWGFWPAVLAAVAVTVAVGLGVERLLMGPLRRRGHLDQILLTFGLALVIAEVAERLWGNEIRIVANPIPFSGTTEIASAVVPTYRLFVAAAGLLLAAALWLLLERTGMGATIRAAVSDPETAMSLGVDVDALFRGVFVVGAALAGLAGAIGLPILGVYHGIDFEILMLGLIVVVIGGLGNTRGALWSAALVGVAETFGRHFLASTANLTVYALMVAVLVLRPSGLFSPAGSR